MPDNSVEKPCSNEKKISIRQPLWKSFLPTFNSFSQCECPVWAGFLFGNCKTIIQYGF